MAATNEIETDIRLKRPSPAYWLWVAENREQIAKDLGTGKGPVVAKKAGEMWKVLADAAKQPFEKRAKEQKDAYDTFIATDEGKKALADKKNAQAEAKTEQNAKGGSKKDKRNERASKAAVKAVEKDVALKKPVPAYWMWLGDNRERIVTMIGTGLGPAVAKKAGEMWKALSDADRQPYEKKAKDQKDTYDKYVASDEGAAKLKAFKDAQSAAKNQFKPKEAPDAAAKEKDAEEEDAPKKASPKKRSAPTTTAAPPAKKGKITKTPEIAAPEIPGAVLKEAEKAQMVGQLKNLMARSDLVASGKSPKQMLEALTKNGGLVNKAKAALLGA